MLFRSGALPSHLAPGGQAGAPGERPGTQATAARLPPREEHGVGDPRERPAAHAPREAWGRGRARAPSRTRNERLGGGVTRRRSPDAREPPAGLASSASAARYGPVCAWVLAQFQKAARDTAAPPEKGSSVLCYVSLINIHILTIHAPNRFFVCFN